jgi:hypothetical protein
MTSSILDPSMSRVPRVFPGAVTMTGRAVSHVPAFQWRGSNSSSAVAASLAILHPYRQNRTLLLFAASHRLRPSRMQMVLRLVTDYGKPVSLRHRRLHYRVGIRKSS